MDLEQMTGLIPSTFQVVFILGIMALVLGAVFVHKVMQPKNYITAVDRTSAEMKTEELLSGADGAYLFNFYAKEEYKTLTIYLSEYQAGELINKSKVADLDYDGIESAKRGVIAVIPDFELFRVKLLAVIYPVKILRTKLKINFFM